jgi:serine protease inhibitor
VQLEIANAVYSDINTPFKREFIELCQRVYAAEAHNEDFSDPKVVGEINSWCSKKTHGKITQIIDRLSKQEKMVLLNAIYFKGNWASQFDKAQTQDDQFTTIGGATVPIKMMHQHEKLDYMCGSNFESVAVPYAGKKQRLHILLPDPGVKMAAFQAQFSKANWDQWMASYHPKDVNLSLPRFKFEYCAVLNDVLKAMGMCEAFERDANFSNLVPPGNRAWINRVLQKTYMDVNEEGTEAAAVTALVEGFGHGLGPRPLVVEFRVDRPFVLALVDDESKEVLFLGSVVKP